MSRGPGRVERAIRALFDEAPPGCAFFTIELVDHCFPDIRDSPTCEAWHTAQVSTLRAGRKIVAADPDWQIAGTYRRNEEAVFFNHSNLQSYALMRMIWRTSNDWRAKLGRHVHQTYRYRATFDDIRARATETLADPKHQALMTPPDGYWWRHVRLHCAVRDGDSETVAALKAQQEAEMAALSGGLRDLIRQADPRITLAEIAGQLRELAVSNDPDVIREGLIGVATLLENLADYRHPE